MTVAPTQMLYCCRRRRRLVLMTVKPTGLDTKRAIQSYQDLIQKKGLLSKTGMIEVLPSFEGIKRREKNVNQP